MEGGKGEGGGGGGREEEGKEGPGVTRRFG